MASYRPPVTRSRLHQHSLFQAERLKLQRIVKVNIAAVKALLEIDSDNKDVEERFERIERYFNQLNEMIQGDFLVDFSNIQNDLPPTVLEICWNLFAERL